MKSYYSDQRQNKAIEGLEIYSRGRNKIAVEKVELKFNTLMKSKADRSRDRLKLPHQSQQLNYTQKDWLLCQEWPNKWPIKPNISSNFNTQKNSDKRDCYEQLTLFCVDPREMNLELLFPSYY